MIQLLFNDKFDEIIEKPITYFKTLEDVSGNIKNFIKNKSDSVVIYEVPTGKNYCPKCIKELNKNTCPNCLKEYELNDIEFRMQVNNINKLKEEVFNFYYYIFDVQNNNILLYIFKEEISYDNPLTSCPYRLSKLEIYESYHVLVDKIINLKTNNQFLYKEIDKILNDMQNDEECDFDLFGSDIYELFEVNKLGISFLFADSLDILKETKLYKYSNIWNLKEYLSTKKLNLSILTYYPIYCKQFEYLVKMKLYNLACGCPYRFIYNGNFKETFGVEKKYYQFMVDNDIGFSQLEALRFFPTTDLELLDFISNDLYITEYLVKYVNMEKLKKYFDSEKLNNDNIYEYYDYIRCCNEIRLSLKNNNILFPKDFISNHDKITSEFMITQNPEINEKMEDISKILKVNQYEDGEFIIFPANDIYSLIDEGSQQSNCVRTYCSLVSNNECQIYFMRYKKDISKSLVTIEVRNGKIVQARTKFNKEPSDKMWEVLRKWEKSMIPVIKNN